MIKTQVQLPDELYRRAKLLAQQNEWSLAEVVRRSLEHMTQVYPPNRQPGKTWRLPKPANLGLPLIPEEQWTEACHD